MTEFVNLDAGETVFFARELESKKSQTYDVVKAPLKAFELIPVSMDAGAGAETISYQQFDETGISKIIANYADDLPRADVKGKEFFACRRSAQRSLLAGLWSSAKHQLRPVLNASNGTALRFTVMRLTACRAGSALQTYRLPLLWRALQPLPHGLQRPLRKS